MNRGFVSVAVAIAMALAAVASSAYAQDRQVYRYTDPAGRVIYSDRAPPTDARDVQAKRLGGNFIENSPMSLAAQQAMERFPVTLYTFKCGDLCQSAEALLNRRGVPFSTVNVEEQKGAEQLKNLTGELNAPVLQVGDKMIAKGYSEQKWQAMLDEAGYPKAPTRSRPGTPTRPPEPAATSANAASAESAAPTGGYPKN